MIKGVFFDLGGTLFSYRMLEQATRSIVGEFAQKLGFNADLGEIMSHYKLANKDADQKFADSSFYLFRDYFEAIYSSFVRRLDSEYTTADFEWFEERLRTTSLSNLELKADCHQTLSSLKARELYLSVVSNIDDEMLHPLIEREGLHRWFDHWTSSEAAQSCKPDARFFEIALEKSGLEPEQVVFVGDSPEQDIQGAYNAGMRTVLISETDSEAPMHVGKKTVEPDYRISELSELVDIIVRES